MSVQYSHPTEFDTTVEPILDADENRIQYNFDALLGRQQREFIFVDYLFEKRPSGLHGAVGTRMRPVHTDEAERMRKLYYDPDESPLFYIYQKEDSVQSWDDWIESQFQFDGLRVIYDTSYSFKYGDVVEQKATQEGIMHPSEVAIVECVGGGRLFATIENDFDTVYDEELLRLVKEAEENGVQNLY